MDHESGSWDVVIAKIISGTCLFFVAIACGILPFKLNSIFKWTDSQDQQDPNTQKKSTMTVNVLLSFGGGVLLATTFLHLLPEINHTIKWLQEQHILPESSLNLGELLMMVGFFLIYLIEELVHAYLHRHQHKKMKEMEREKDLGAAFMRGVNARNSAIMKGFPSTTSANDAVPTIPSVEDAAKDTQTQAQSHGHSHTAGILPTGEEEDMLVTSLRGLLIVLALSIHELFEGFAVGLEKTSAGVYFMFAAVSAHKFVIAFCIGVELMVQRTKLWLAFVYVIIYSVVSAIGIGIGTILTAGPNASDLQVPNVILQGLATGTLLYVIFFEVLSKERSGLLPYLSVCAGFLLMFGLQYIAGITESQGSDGSGHQHHHH